jgi:phage tail-like protein
MADTRNDPFPAFRFEVQIDGMAASGFSECSGLTLEITTEDYAEGGQNSYMRKFPGRTKQTNLVFKHGIVDSRLWDWFYDLTQGSVTLRGGTIIVYDPSGSEQVMIWSFKDAFPVKWSGPDLNASQNAVAVETLEICHQGLTREK